MKPHQTSSQRITLRDRFALAYAALWPHLPLSWRTYLDGIDLEPRLYREP